MTDTAPDCTIDDLTNIVKGPDFPTGAVIMGKNAAKEAYRTGQGKVIVRAVSEIEETSRGRQQIIVTEIPYQVNKARLIEKMAEMVKEKRLEGISEIRDESNRKGMRIVIELKKDANANIILNRLYKHTQMQETISMIMLAIVNGKPRILNLREILDEYLKHQKEVVTRRTIYDKKKAEARAHILEGYRIALDNIDEIIHIIRNSYNDAKEKLMERFGLSEIQAQAILDMQLRRLQGLEKEKIENEYQDLLKKIAYYNELLADEHKLMGVVKDELTEIKKELLPYMEKALGSHGESMLFFMLTDIMEQSTELLFYGEGSEEMAVNAFKIEPKDGTIYLKGVVSRKKQLIPPLMEAAQMIGSDYV